MTKKQEWPELLDYSTPLIIGADNGKSGFLVFMNTDRHIIHIEQYPNDAKRLYQLIEYFKPVYAAIEEVFMAPGFKGVASSNFEIMGRYKQVFEMLDIPYETVRAVSWRAKLGIKAKGRDNQKQAAIDYSATHFSKEDYQKLWTKYNKLNKETHHKEEHFDPDNNKCESALIALYALQKYKEKH